MEQKKVEKKNVLCLSFHGYCPNFCCFLNNNEKYNFILKNDLSNLSLESYDIFIIGAEVFYYENAIKTLDKIYTFNKPVIMIYSNELSNNLECMKYFKIYYGIKFEKKDAAIIEDTYNGYLPDRFENCALSMISKKGQGKAYIKNTNNCFILKFGNITIMHDCEISKTEKGLLRNTTGLLIDLLNASNSEQKPEWVDNIKIIDEVQIEKDIERIDKEIKNLQCEKTECRSNLENKREYKKLLYTTGDELVQTVKKVLIEMLDIKIKDLDIKKEDLSFELEGINILVEVKGVNTSIKREYVSQIHNHILDSAKEKQIEDDEISKNYKGLLIVNPYTKEPIQERITKEFYSKTVIGDLQHFNICAIDTITLLGLFNKFKIVGNIDLKDIILNSNYIKPEFSILNLK